MKISIIIPTLNEELFIGRTLRAIKENAARPRELEIIVADGGSEDRTTASAQKEGAKIVHAYRARRSIQMNEGAAAATGGIYYFLHADARPPLYFDRYIRHKLAGRYRAGCFRLSFDSAHPLLRFYGWCTRFDIDLFRFGDQSLFVTAPLFKQAGGFRRDHKLLEDNDIVRRLKRAAPFVISPQKVTVSARKYRANGAVRLQLVYALLVILHRLGLAQPKLYHLYKWWVH